jgi:hypothetical protein
VANEDELLNPASSGDSLAVPSLSPAEQCEAISAYYA